MVAAGATSEDGFVVTVDKPTTRLPYADHLINHIVVNAPVPESEIQRVLVPGGVALVGDRKITKPWPAAFDEWTHFEHDAGRSGISRDEVAGPPRTLAWIAGEEWPGYLTFRAPPPGFVSAGGRNFYWLPELTARSPKARHDRSRLVCRDAFNGKLCWSVAIDVPAAATCLVATNDRVYVHPGAGQLLAYRAADGQVLRRYEQSPAATLLLVQENVLLTYDRSGTAAALDAESGALLWRKQFAPGWHRPDGMVADSTAAYVLSDSQLLALELRTGAVRWTTDVGVLLSETRLLSLVSVRDGLLLLSDSPRAFKPSSAANHAIDARSGAVLWSYRYAPTDHGGGATSVFHLGDRVWVKAKSDWVGLDPQSGREVSRLPGARTRCYPDHATTRHFFSGFMDFVGLQKGEAETFEGSRSACLTGFFPANGLVYTLPTRCHCFPMLRGYLGLSAAPPAPEEPPELRRGPAFSSPITDHSSPTDWPTFRGNDGRSGSTPSKIGGAWEPVWSAKLSGAPSAITVAGGVVFVAVPERHEIVAVAQGAIRWRFTAGARVDSPPTLVGGRVVFGCADGWVYCLEAASGTLVWQWRVAPAERFIVVREQLESAWPLHGAVLCREGVVYAVAGRHTYLDGGLVLAACDLASGRELWRRRLDRAAGAELADILQWQNGVIACGANGQFDPQTGATVRAGGRGLWAPHTLVADNRAQPGMSTDDRWFSRWILAERIRRFDKAMGHPRFARLPAMRGDVLAFDDTQAAVVLQGFDGENVAQLTDLSGTVVWEQPVAEPCVAVLLAADVVVFAGEPGWLSVRARNDGRELARVTLPSAPVWDGLAAADGMLYLAATDGAVLCWKRIPPG